MVDIYAQYKDRGFTILAFPSNQFGGQEPWPEAEVKAWTAETFGVTFPMFSKIDVNGDNTHPVYAYLKSFFPGDIRWNFKGVFLVGRDGVPICRFDDDHDWDHIRATIDTAVNE